MLRSALGVSRKYSFLARPVMGKIASLASIGGTLSNVALFRRFLADIAGVVALTILSSMITGLLVIFGFYWMYIGLVSYGMMPEYALLSLTSAACVLAIGLITWTAFRIQRLRHVSMQSLHSEIPGVSRVGHVVNAFFDGLKEGHVKN